MVIINSSPFSASEMIIYINIHIVPNVTNLKNFLPITQPVKIFLAYRPVTKILLTFFGAMEKSFCETHDKQTRRTIDKRR